MVYRNEELDLTFAALAAPARRAVVAALAGRERTISELAAPLPMSLVAVSKHIGVLERAGLLRRSRSGRSQVCVLTARPLASAAGWLDGYRDYWAGQLDALERYLAGPA